jgi:hypothetical protein
MRVTVTMGAADAEEEIRPVDPTLAREPPVELEVGLFIPGWPTDSWPVGFVIAEAPCPA